MAKVCLQKQERRAVARRRSLDMVGGDEGDRTPDLMNAIHALSQLSYVPRKTMEDYSKFSFGKSTKRVFITQYLRLR